MSKSNKNNQHKKLYKGYDNKAGVKKLFKRMKGELWEFQPETREEVQLIKKGLKKLLKRVNKELKDWDK